MNKSQNTRKKTDLKKVMGILIFLFFSILFLYHQNNTIITTNIIIQSDRLPQAFNGYKIVHLSDLHGKAFGREQGKLVGKIKRAQPDIIVFTGDLVDSRRYREEYSLELMNKITSIADVYYVTGNHEWASGRYPALERALLDIGVKVLRNTTDRIKRDEDHLYIIGIDDPLSGYKINDEHNTVDQIIQGITVDISKEESFHLLLAHRPEFFPIYSQYNIDLIFSGHAHGGQFRLPFIGGLVAPGQGLLPKYTSGEYKENNSTMVVSRGLGNSIFPQRLFNRPEIIVMKLVK